MKKNSIKFNQSEGDLKALNSESSKNVNDFHYLESWIYFCSKDVSVRIGKAWFALHKLDHQSWYPLCSFYHLPWCPLCSRYHLSWCPFYSIISLGVPTGLLSVPDDPSVLSHLSWCLLYHLLMCSPGLSSVLLSPLFSPSSVLASWCQLCSTISQLESAELAERQAK